MAVQPWELDEKPPQPAPLILVPPPTRRGHPIGALLLVIAVVATLAAPALRAPRPEAGPAASARALPVASLPSLDDVRAVPRSGRPMSRDPLTGIAFVRCTKIWTARTDGSDERLLLDMPGVSSPTVAPNGRTIAFLQTDGNGQHIYLAGGDGSSPMHVGTLSHAGEPVRATALNLTWSPSRNMLAFALVTPSVDPQVGGSAVFVLDLDDGTFTRLAAGGPGVFWDWSVVSFTDLTARGPVIVSQRPFARHGRVQRRLIRPDGTEHTADVVIERWGTRGPGVAVLRTEGDRQEIGLRYNTYSRGEVRKVSPPANARFSTSDRPVLAQDGRHLLATLIDPRGERDLGVYDLDADTWKVLDYAWSAAQSQAPAATGPVGKRRVLGAAGSLLSNWSRRPDQAMLLTGGPLDEDLLPIGSRLGYAVRDANKVDGGWTVTATAWGRTSKELGRRWIFRRLRLRVSSEEGRLRVEPQPTSALQTLRTPADAFAMLSQTLDVPIVAPPALPEGTRLSTDWPIEAWTYEEGASGSVRLTVPGRRGPTSGMLVFGYGDQYFSMGCGGAEGRPGTVLDQPALVGRLGRFSQVIWPVVNGDPPGRFSVYGTLPAVDLRALAESIEAAR